MTSQYFHISSYLLPCQLKKNCVRKYNTTENLVKIEKFKKLFLQDNQTYTQINFIQRCQKNEFLSAVNLKPLVRYDYVFACMSDLGYLKSDTADYRNSLAENQYKSCHMGSLL